MSKSLINITKICAVIAIMLISTLSCFADVEIELNHKTIGKTPDNAKVYFEFESPEDAPLPEVPRADMTNKEKGKFVLPINEQGLYKYNAYKRTLINGQEMISDDKYEIEILVTNTGEQVIVMSKGDGKEKSISYDSLFIDPAVTTHKDKSRENTQTGDNILKNIIAAILAFIAMIFLMGARLGKRRSVEDFDL